MASRLFCPMARGHNHHFLASKGKQRWDSSSHKNGCDTLPNRCPAAATLNRIDVHKNYYYKYPTKLEEDQNQRQSTLDYRYLTLLCDNLKKRLLLQNFFS
jgi:hypothetical protein